MPHTPGPWHVLKQHEDFFLVYAGDYATEGEPDLLAEVVTPNPEDAYLMAAAPELLDALEELLRWFDDGVSTYEPHCSPEYAAMWRKVRKAIAKARGKHKK